MKYNPKQVDAVCDLYLKKSKQKEKSPFTETHVSEIAKDLSLEEKYIWIPMIKDFLKINFIEV